jgi:hypothetical protein
MKVLDEDRFERNMREYAYFLAPYFGQTPETYNSSLKLHVNDPRFSGIRDWGVIVHEREIGKDVPDYSTWKSGKNYFNVDVMDPNTYHQRFDLYYQENKSHQIDVQPHPKWMNYPMNQTFNISIQQDMLSVISSMQPSNFFMTMIYLNGIYFESSNGRGAHSNILIIHRISINEYVIQRFEPNYEISYNYGLPAGIDSMMNTSNLDFINQGLAQSFQSLLGVTVRYERYIPTTCPIIGPQLDEGRLSGFDEEIKGYCFYWSMALLFELINLIQSSAIPSLEQVLELANTNLTRQIESKIGSTYGEKTKNFIRSFTSERMFSLFANDALGYNFKENEAWKIMKYVHKTIPYPHVVEIFLRNISDTIISQCQVQIYPTKIIVESWPWDEFQTFENVQSHIEAFSTNKSYYEGIYDDYYGVYIKIDNKVYRTRIDVETIDDPKDLRTGVLQMKDNSSSGYHAKKDIEHVNGIIIQKTVSGFTLYRFEPQYKGDNTDVERMINLSEASHWNSNITRVFSYLYNYDKPENEKISITYKPVRFDTCPAIGSYGPQYLEYTEPREEGEHIGYCQTWSFIFLEKFLQKLCVPGQTNNGKRKASTSTSGQFALESIIEEVYEEADISSSVWLAEVQRKLYVYIKNKASQYCKMLFDEVYVPYFRYKIDPSNPLIKYSWQKNTEKFEKNSF